MSEMRYKTKMPADELHQLKIVLNFLADQWQNTAPVQAKTLRVLLPRIEALPSGAPQNHVLAAVHDAIAEGLKNA